MTKKDKNYMINAYLTYLNQPENCGLGNIYNSWSDKKQESFDKIKRELKSNFEFFDLRTLWGNSSFYTCGAIVNGENNNLFIVYNASGIRWCYENSGMLIDKNTGEIFFHLKA